MILSRVGKAIRLLATSLIELKSPENLSAFFKNKTPKVIFAIVSPIPHPRRQEARECQVSHLSLARFTWSMSWLSNWKEREPSGDVTSIAKDRDGLLLKLTLHVQQYPPRGLFVCGPRTHSTEMLSEMKQVSKVRPARKKQEVPLKKEICLLNQLWPSRTGRDSLAKKRSQLLSSRPVSMLKTYVCRIDTRQVT